MAGGKDPDEEAGPLYDLALSIPGKEKKMKKRISKRRRGVEEAHAFGGFLFPRTLGWVPFCYCISELLNN